MGHVRIDPFRDPETQAFSAAYLAEAFERERAKAVRFRRPLSLVFLSIGDYGSKADGTPAGQGTETLAHMVEEIRKSLRDSDFIARFAQDRFCVVLPETDRYGSGLAIRRLRKAIREMEIFRFPGRKTGLVPLFASSCCPGDGTGFAELYRAAEERFRRQKESPLRRLHLVDKPFWEAFDILTDGAECRIPVDGEESPSWPSVAGDLGRNGYFSLPHEEYRRFMEAIAQDVRSIGNSRGTLVAAGPRPEIFRRILLSFDAAGPDRGGIFILGRAGEAPPDEGNITHVIAGDEELREKEFLLYAKADGAYGIFAKERRDEMRGFHTADEWLVDAMIEKLQENHPLQGIR